ncbi:hypothetical protein ROHU_003430 [Labeo rohita]|uniref:Uncharacterized protein n=1 Tax=Labeo rohita TaxID=84645 RepID=A0A498NWL1_LABRO|nr:hypothetical protein ROHU_003430 [Labeo rohita]
MRQCGNTKKAPAGEDTAAAVWKWRKGSCGSNRCYGRVEIQRRLLRERTLLRQCGNTENLLREQALLGQWGNAERAPAVAGCCWDGWSGDEPLWVVLVVSKGVAMVGLKFE